MDNLNLNFIKLGDRGDIVVMLHGWGHSIDSLRGLGELLAESYQVYLLDLPGFGESPMPPDGWGPAEYAEQVVAFLDRHNLKKVILFGHSFGGQLSIRIASAHPERVEKLVLLNSAGIKRQLTAQEQRKFGLIRILRNTVKGLDSALGLRLFESWFIPRFGSEDYKNAGALRPVLVKGINQDLSEEARRIGAPTLLLWGEKDTATPLEIGMRLRQMIKNSKLVVLYGRGHIPFQGSGAHLCAYHMLPFMRDSAENLHAAAA